MATATSTSDDGGMTLTALEASEGARGWRLLLGRLHLTVDCGGFDEALEFIERVAEIANDQNHHPDIDLRYNRVHLAVVSHDAGGLTDRDVRLAEAICVIVDELDLKPERASLTEVEIAIDTTRPESLRPVGRVGDGTKVSDRVTDLLALAPGSGERPESGTPPSGAHPGGMAPDGGAA